MGCRAALFRSMRSLLFGSMGCAGLLFAMGNPPVLRLIDRLDESIQRRFVAPMPDALGMSRVMMPASFGRHFQPLVTSTRDFQPAGPIETKAIQELEADGVQVGLYLFGAAILHAERPVMDFRALKGPGTLTRGTPRPNWYPLLAKPVAVSADALPDWNAIYPLARKAMKSFDDGGKGFETKIDSWHIAARPVMASEQTCVSCHNNPAYGRRGPVAKLDRPLGGVLYAYRNSLGGIPGRVRGEE